MLENEKQYHAHTGFDGSPKIDPKNFRGYPIFTSAPTHEAEEGTIVLMDDGSSSRKLYAMLGGTWYATTLS